MATTSKTFLDRLLHHAAQQGIEITEDLRAIIVKVTEEVTAVDKSLVRAAKKRKRAKPLAKAKAEIKATVKAITAKKKPAVRKKPAAKPRAKR